LLLFVIVVRAYIRHLPTELPQKPNLPAESIICRRSCRWSQIAKYLPTELPRSQICRRSDMIADRADGAKYLLMELLQKPNLPTEPIVCRCSQVFADGAKYLPTEPTICQLSCPEARFAVGAK
jgi:hypothetical protein